MVAVVCLAMVLVHLRNSVYRMYAYSDSALFYNDGADRLTAAGSTVVRCFILVLFVLYAALRPTSSATPMVLRTVLGMFMLWIGDVLDATLRRLVYAALDAPASWRWPLSASSPCSHTLIIVINL